MPWASGFRGLGFRGLGVQGLGLRVEGLGFREPAQPRELCNALGVRERRWVIYYYLLKNPKRIKSSNSHIALNKEEHFSFFRCS